MASATHIPKCCQCDAAACVFVSFVQDGELQQKQFCEQHAKAQGILRPKAYGLLDGDTIFSHPNKPQQPELPHCKQCNLGLADWERGGQLGCPSCYENFFSVLRGVLRKFHRADRHAGKIPIQARIHAKLKARDQKIQCAQKQLQNAIEQEDYENAATQRDHIKALQEQA